MSLLLDYFNLKLNVFYPLVVDKISNQSVISLLFFFLRFFVVHLFDLFQISFIHTLTLLANKPNSFVVDGYTHGRLSDILIQHKIRILNQFSKR